MTLEAYVVGIEYEDGEWSEFAFVAANDPDEAWRFWSLIDDPEFLDLCMKGETGYTCKRWPKFDDLIKTPGRFTASLEDQRYRGFGFGKRCISCGLPEQLPNVAPWGVCHECKQCGECGHSVDCPRTFLRYSNY